MMRNGRKITFEWSQEIQPGVCMCKVPGEKLAYIYSAKRQARAARVKGRGDRLRDTKGRC
jgi:hypothetical protein